MPRPPEAQALFERSGMFSTHEKLVSFLYELMRDHLPPGVVERLVQNNQETPASLTNGYLAQYAKDLADRLK